MTLLLSRSDLERLVDTPATVALIEDAFLRLSTGEAEQSPVVVVNDDRAAAKFLVLAGLSHLTQTASTKTFADVPRNALAGLPTQRSLISLFSAVTGEPLAVLDGRVPTRERTAATSAVATKFLSRPESRVLGLVGAGGLAAPHVRSIMQIRDIQTVRVWSRTPDTVERLRAQLDDLPVEFVACTSAESAVRESDIVCTLTPSSEPVVSAEWFRPGTHINAVGAPPRPTHREIDSRTMASASVTVDDIAAALQKSGDVVIPLTEGLFDERHISRTLTDVVGGTVVGRHTSDEVTLFNSVGTGIQDLTVGTLYFERAMARDIGTRFAFAE
ncbi:MAG: hypothetical protein JWR01_660 [Subtercola sp.]|nr:hypothetical protein [Subtercola sp.]